MNKRNKTFKNNSFIHITRLFQISCIFTLIILSVYNLSFSYQLKVTLKKKEQNKLKKMEMELLQMINQERKKHNILQLKYHKKVYKVAQNHSEKMAREQKLSHAFPLYPKLQKRLSQSSIFFNMAAENVACSNLFNTKRIHNGFVKSKGHRKNILNPKFTHCGIGIVKKKQKYYVTQNFIRDFPIKNESEIEINLTKDLQAWYKNNFNRRLSFSKKWCQEAKQASKRLFKGKRKYIISRRKKITSLYNIISTEIEQVKEMIKKKIKELYPRIVGIGVTFGKNRKYPGGAYFFSIIFIS